MPPRYSYSRSRQKFPQSPTSPHSPDQAQACPSFFDRTRSEGATSAPNSTATSSYGASTHSSRHGSPTDVPPTPMPGPIIPGSSPEGGLPRLRDVLGDILDHRGVNPSLERGYGMEERASSAGPSSTLRAPRSRSRDSRSSYEGDRFGELHSSEMRAQIPTLSSANVSWPPERGAAPALLFQTRTLPVPQLRPELLPQGAMDDPVTSDHGRRMEDLSGSYVSNPFRPDAQDAEEINLNYNYHYSRGPSTSSAAGSAYGQLAYSQGYVHQHQQPQAQVQPGYGYGYSPGPGRAGGFRSGSGSRETSFGFPASAEGSIGSEGAGSDHDYGFGSRPISREGRESHESGPGPGSGNRVGEGSGGEMGGRPAVGSSVGGTNAGQRAVSGESGKTGGRKKAYQACEFCRRRKLRCDGNRPCRQCVQVSEKTGGQAGVKCEYAPFQRRRGPGKAPKGLKSKKRKVSGGGASGSGGSSDVKNEGDGTDPEG